ncbi:MAG: hypothetical protein RL481_58 [Pseudomonadota bacterium]|jgi:uncharacterized protein
MRLVWLLSGLLLLAGCSKPAPDVPEPKPELKLTGRVMDRAGIIDPRAKERIAKRLAMAEKLYGPQMVVVTVPTLKGKAIADYSIDLARALQVGDAKRNDGLLLLVAPTERKLRIEVGIGLEGSFSDIFAGKIIRETITPAFKKGDFTGGIEAGVDRMIRRMKEVPTLPANDNLQSLDPEKVA